MAEKYDIKRPRLQKKAEPDKKILFSRNIDSKQSKTNEATLKVTFIVKFKLCNYTKADFFFFFLFFYLKTTHLDGKTVWR